MAAELDIHAASHDELLAAHRNVFDIWSKGRGLEDHVGHRLRSPTHRRAEWFVGSIDGRVVTSLAAHPVRFRAGSEELSGIAIGSVYTVSDVRGKGYAPRLIAWVEDHERERNVGLSMLYSDVKPDYYARQGYVLCPSWEGWRDPGDELQAPTHRLVPFAIDEHLARVKRLYADDHGAAPLSIVRNDDYWTMMLEKFSGNPFYALVGPDGAWVGYVMVGPSGGEWRVIDYALAERSDALAEQFYAAFLTLARAQGAKRAGGWLPDSAAARKFFTLAPRATEITMIKPLAWPGTLSADAIAGTSRICELDHV